MIITCCEVYCCPSSSFAFQLSRFKDAGASKDWVTSSLFGSFPASSLQFDPKIHWICHYRCRTTSFLNQVQEKTNERGNLLAYSPAFLEFSSKNVMER